MEDNADSVFTTQISETETEPITSTNAIELEETTTTSNEIFNDEDIDITTNEIPDETTTESMKDRDGKIVSFNLIINYKEIK